MSNKRSYIRGLLIALAGVLIFSFQNCQKIAFLQNPSGSLGFKTIVNNGEPYGGMTDAHYFRLVPDFTCENKVAPTAQLEILNSKVLLTENKKLQCAATNSLAIDASLVDWSIYQNDIIGYQEGIFDGKMDSPDVIPANLVEVWCRDSQNPAAMESIMHFNRSTNQAVNRLYRPKSLVPDFPVTRTIAEHEVIVKSEGQFELHVFRDQPAAQAGLFAGTLHALLDGVSEDHQVSCRLGGLLDPSVWPVKQIVDLNVEGKLAVSPDLNYLAYVSSSVGNARFYLAKVDGSGQSPMGNPSLSNYAAFSPVNFLFSPTSDSLAFNSDYRSPGFFDLLTRPLASANFTLLTSPVVDWGTSGITGDFQYSPDGKTLLYREAVPHAAGQAFDLYNLKAITLGGGGSAVVLNPLVTTPTRGVPASYRSVSNFLIAKKANRVVFVCCNYLGADQVQGDVYSSDFIGQNLIKISEPLPPGWNYDPSFIPAGDHQVVLQASNKSDLTALPRYFIAQLDASAPALPLPQGTYVVDPNTASSNILLLSSGFLPQQVMNLASGQTLPLPQLYLPNQPYSTSHNPPYFISQNSSYFVGRKDLGGGRTQAFSLDTVSGSSQDLCPGLPVGDSSLLELGNNKLILVNLENASQLIRVYQVELGKGVCQELNRTLNLNPTQNSIEDLSLSPDHLKLLLRVGKNGLDNSKRPIEVSSALYYVPLNGAPPVRVDSPVLGQGVISRALFLADSKSVIIWGSQVRASEQNIYRWSVKP